jgi:hypothetical protein
MIDQFTKNEAVTDAETLICPAESALSESSPTPPPGAICMAF